MKASQVSQFFQFDWSSEVYGIGSAIRQAIKYPRFLPLFFSSDHGVKLNEEIALDEINELPIKPIFYLTWSPDVYVKNASLRRPRVIRVTHPYLLCKELREKAKIKGRGTIYFPYHTVPSFESKGIADIDSIQFLKSLEEKYNPIKICLHNNDVGGVRHSLYLNHGYQVVSAGNQNDPSFAKNLFTLICSSEYGISESWGSQVAYLKILKRKTLIIKRDITDIKRGNATQERIIETSKEQIAKTNQISDLLTIDELESENEEADRFIQKYLGADWRYSRLKLFFVAWSSLIILGPSWFAVVGSRRLIARLRI